MTPWCSPDGIRVHGLVGPVRSAVRRWARGVGVGVEGVCLGVLEVLVHGIRLLVLGEQLGGLHVPAQRQLLVRRLLLLRHFRPQQTTAEQHWDGHEREERPQPFVAALLVGGGDPQCRPQLLIVGDLDACKGVQRVVEGWAELPFRTGGPRGVGGGS